MISPNRWDSKRAKAGARGCDNGSQAVQKVDVTNLDLAMTQTDVASHIWPWLLLSGFTPVANSRPKSQPET